MSDFPDDDRPDPRHFIHMTAVRDGETDRPDDYLPGTNPFADAEIKQEKAKKRFACADYSGSSRATDWLGGSSPTGAAKPRRSWRVKEPSPIKADGTEQVGQAENAATLGHQRNGPNQRFAPVGRWKPPPKDKITLPPWMVPPSDSSKPSTGGSLATSKWKSRMAPVPVPPPVNTAPSTSVPAGGANLEEMENQPTCTTSGEKKCGVAIAVDTTIRPRERPGKAYEDVVGSCKVAEMSPQLCDVKATTDAIREHAGEGHGEKKEDTKTETDVAETVDDGNCSHEHQMLDSTKEGGDKVDEGDIVDNDSAPDCDSEVEVAVVEEADDESDEVADDEAYEVASDSEQEDVDEDAYELDTDEEEAGKFYEHTAEVEDDEVYEVVSASEQEDPGEDAYEVDFEAEDESDDTNHAQGIIGENDEGLMGENDDGAAAVDTGDEPATAGGNDEDREEDEVESEAEIEQSERERENSGRVDDILQKNLSMESTVDIADKELPEEDIVEEPSEFEVASESEDEGDAPLSSSQPEPDLEQPSKSVTCQEPLVTNTPSKITNPVVDDGVNPEDDRPDPREFMLMTKVRNGETDRPDDYLPGTDPFTDARRKKEKAKKKYAGGDTSGKSRVDDWLGSGKTKQRTWQVKGTH